MLTELNKILETGEFEDDGYIRLQRVQWLDAAVQVTLDVNTGDEAATHQGWLIESVGRTFASRFVEGVAYDFAIERNHVVLWPFTRPQVQLFFKGNVGDPLSLAGALYQEHRNTTQGWFSFDKFLNQEQHLPKLLSGGYGKLADGPDLLIEKYIHVLRRYGVEPSTLPPRPPKAWDNDRWITIDGNVAALLFGDSFVVARDFTLRRITEGSDGAT